MAGGQRLSRSERERRDSRMFAMFAEGATYREIGAAVGLRSVSGVHRIIKRELVAGASRRDVLLDDAFAVWQEREETLFRAHWERALGSADTPPDHRSAELCRKLLANQARVYGLGVDVPLPAPTATLAHDHDDQDDDEDDLSRLRAKRHRTTGGS